MKLPRWIHTEIWKMAFLAEQIVAQSETITTPETKGRKISQTKIFELKQNMYFYHISLNLHIQVSKVFAYNWCQKKEY